MPLVVITGPVRSGKSQVAALLAAESGLPVAVVVAGRAEDAEMSRRIANHQTARPSEWRTIEVADPLAWVDGLGDEECILVDCLGSLVSLMMMDVRPKADGTISYQDESGVEKQARALTDALLARHAATVVVSNETGWSVVSANAIARLFTDVLARATARLVEGSQTSWLVVAGRCVELTSLPREAAWTRDDRE